MVRRSFLAIVDPLIYEIPPPQANLLHKMNVHREGWLEDGNTGAGFSSQAAAFFSLPNLVKKLARAGREYLHEKEEVGDCPALLGLAGDNSAFPGLGNADHGAPGDVPDTLWWEFKERLAAGKIIPEVFAFNAVKACLVPPWRKRAGQKKKRFKAEDGGEEVEGETPGHGDPAKGSLFFGVWTYPQKADTTAPPSCSAQSRAEVGGSSYCARLTADTCERPRLCRVLAHFMIQWAEEGEKLYLRRPRIERPARSCRSVGPARSSTADCAHSGKGFHKRIVFRCSVLSGRSGT